MWKRIVGGGKKIWQKRVARYALIALLVALFFYGGFVAIFYHALNDPSSGAPLFDGPILPDARQQPVASRFDHKTTAMEVVRGLDLTGRNVVITGGHSGTGREAARALASAGTRVTALARDVERAKANLKGMANVEVEYVDLLKPDSIAAFAERYVASGRPLHILINSAGIMGTPLERDARGYERQFATNVLGHYELTIRLRPALARAGGARVVNLSSRGHRAGGVLFDDVNFERTEYSGMRAYAQTKTALALLTVKMDALWQGDGIRAFAVHPGPVPTSDLFAAGRVGHDSVWTIRLARWAAGFARTFWVTEVLNTLRAPRNVGDLYKTVQQGGATTVWAAANEELAGRGGLYLEDCNIAVKVPEDSPAPFGVRPWALDPDAADRLWRLCGEMTGLRENGNRGPIQ